MYTRHGCHLCTAAWDTLRRQQRRFGFDLVAVDIDTDSDLVSKHGESVPVVTVDGRIRFRGGVNAVLLRRVLAAEMAKATRKDG